jgi:hypothetical protein
MSFHYISWLLYFLNIRTLVSDVAVLLPLYHRYVTLHTVCIDVSFVSMQSNRMV